MSCNDDLSLSHTMSHVCAHSSCCVILSLLAHGDIETGGSSLGLSINQNNPFVMGHRLNWYLMITALKSPCPKGNHSSGYDLDLLSHIINSCQTTNIHDYCSLSGRVATDTVAKEFTLPGNLRAVDSDVLEE
jgi:hypothetical protein